MDEGLYIQEKVKFNTEIMKVLVLTALATISAEITLFYQWEGFTGKNFILSFSGLIVIFVMIGSIINLYKNNNALIERLK